MKIYLNKDFLTNFFLKTNSEEDIYFFLRKLLCSAQSEVEVIVDFDFEEAYKDPSLRPLLRQIAQKLPVTDITFVESCQNSTFHDNGQARLFLLDGLARLNLEERFGCLTADSESIPKIEFLFNGVDFRINKTMRDWSGLSRFKHPCNSLLITDNYLFSNDDQLDNIKGILKALMPLTLDPGFTFHLTVIGFDTKKAFQSIHKQKSDLEEFLEKNYSYTVELTIIREDHHDRYIFTNYGRLSSGKGFGLFKKGKLSENDETTVSFHPITQGGRLSSIYFTRDEELEKCRMINRTERLPARLAGNRNNRLLV